MEEKNMNGKIKWYNARKGFGFIESEDGKDIFVHRSSVPDGVFLNEGDSVEFETEETDKGVKAVNIKKQ
jgi:cold shock protein